MKCLGILLCFLSLAAFAAGPPKLLDLLRTEFQHGVKSLPADTPAEDLRELSRIESMLSESWSDGPGDRQRARPGGRYADVIESLMELEASTRSANVDAFCETFITELRTVLPEASKAFRESFNPTVREAFATGLDATSPKEIDAPLLTLTRLQEQQTNLEGSSSEVLQFTRQILTTFQNGLLGLTSTQSGRYGSPANDLANLASNSSMVSLFAEIMPRSEFMAKMRAAEAKAALAPGRPQKLSSASSAQAISDLINGIKTLDEMAATVVRIDALKDQQRQMGNALPESQPESLLRFYARTYAYLRTDGTLSISDLIRIHQLPMPPHPELEGQPIARLRDMLFRAALPRVLGAPADLTPHEDESTAGFLQRARAVARATANWNLYQNILTYASQQENHDNSAFTNLAAFRSFTAAINLDTSGQHREAVKSYLKALATGAQDIPLDYIREHLEAIHKAFPEAYAEATQITEVPASVTRPVRRTPRQEVSFSPNHIPPTKENLRYAGRNEQQILDFYQAKSGKPTPLLLYIHGGSWTSGDKNNPDGLQTFLDAGISVVSINYRFTADAYRDGIEPPVRAPMEDAARALQFVRSKAREWNINGDRIGAVGGYQDGACASLWLAFHPDMADPKSKDPVAHESTRLWCAAASSPMTSFDPQQMREWAPHITFGHFAFGFPNFEDSLRHRDQILPWIAEYSLYALVTKDDPPVYLYYEKPPAPPLQKEPSPFTNYGVKLQEHCSELGVPCELVYPGAPDVKHKTITDYLLDKLKAEKAR